MSKKLITTISAVLLASALAGAAAAEAADGVHFTTVEQVAIGSRFGTYAATGDINDAGTTVFTRFRAEGPFVPVVTEHIQEIYNGAAGTLTIRQQCLSTFEGFFFGDSCNVVVVDGTGAYTGLLGSAKCQGVINLITRIASRTCDYSLVGPRL